MIDISTYRGLRVAVFGLGKSGTSVLRALKAGRASVLAWDDNPASREALLTESRPAYVVLALHRNLVDPASYKWDSIAALVLSPGIPFTHPTPHPVVLAAQQAGVPVVCDIELLHNAYFHANFIGITGTNGKSTTTSLIGHILKAAKIRTEIGGNLGVPALELEPLARDGTYVLEVSSYQLDLLDHTRFNTAIVLNITPDHLDRHGGMAGYIAAKRRIFNNQTASDTAIIAIDTAPARALYDTLLAEGHAGRIIPLSTKNRVTAGISIIDGILYNDIDTTDMEGTPLPPLPHLPGQHNTENIAASIATCYVQGIDINTIVEAITTFPGLQHRLQQVKEVNGIRFINDSKATNAEAAEKALLSFDTIYWILGGVAKTGGITAISHCFPRVAHAFLIGEAADAFAHTLEGRVPFSQCGNLQHAVEAAYQQARQEGKQDAVVLLSPACASFDQWANFEARGEAFCAMVHALE